MKHYMYTIAILNDCSLDIKHIRQLKKLGKVIQYEETKTEQEVIARLKNIDIAIVDILVVPFTKKVLETSKKLKFIAINSTGFDEIDLTIANERGILVANPAGYATQAVAEHTIALLFALVRNIPLADTYMKKDPFEIHATKDKKREEKFFTYQLKDKTLGIIGLGRIGTKVADLAQCLGMKMVAWNRSPKQVKGVKMLKTINQVLSLSDIVSLHLALAPELTNCIGKNELSLMKSSAFLINTARGALIDTKALYYALKSRKILGAGLDVSVNMNKSSLLLQLSNVILTPHSAFYTKEALALRADIICENVESFIKGKPINVVNNL